MKCKEIQCKSALHKINSPYLPFHWDLNIYRGCSHGCKYCYALYSHNYLQDSHCEGYFRDIVVKSNIVEQLERQLQKASWKREAINIGGVTDSYQPIEKHYQLMPEVLRLLIKYKTPCIISTKSDLILRDYDLIMKLSQVADVNIAATITCFEEKLQQIIEPGASSTGRRLEVLKAFAGENIVTGMHIMPIIPYLTDSRENLEPLYKAAKDMGISYVLPGLLNLRGPTRVYFFDFVKQTFPLIYQQLFLLYQNKELWKEYRKSIYSMVHELDMKYQVKYAGRKMLQRKEKKTEIQYEQISLF